MAGAADASGPSMTPEQLDLPLAPPRPPPTRARKKCAPSRGHLLVRLDAAPGTEGMGTHPFDAASGPEPLYDCRCSRCGEEFRWILTERGAVCCHATEKT